MTESQNQTPKEKFDSDLNAAIKRAKEGEGTKMEDVAKFIDELPEREYEVHVHGPDDVLPAADRADAERQVKEINDLNLDLVSAHVIVDGDFSCVVASVIEESLEGVYVTIDDETDMTLDKETRAEIARIVLEGLKGNKYKVVSDRQKVLINATLEQSSVDGGWTSMVKIPSGETEEIVIAQGKSPAAAKEEMAEALYLHYDTDPRETMFVISWEMLNQ